MTFSTPTRRLADWLEKHCDGDWEHSYGVAIDTIDNPGWVLRVDLADTELAGVEFPPLKQERSDHDWIHCSVDGGVFKGAGGVCNLDELITCFLDWAAQFGNPNRSSDDEST